MKVSIAVNLAAADTYDYSYHGNDILIIDSRGRHTIVTGEKAKELLSKLQDDEADQQPILKQYFDDSFTASARLSPKKIAKFAKLMRTSRDSVRIEPIDETPYIYRKKIGDKWVLCEKYDWPEVWVHSNGKKSYEINIDGELYEFSHVMRKYMKQMNTEEDIKKPEKPLPPENPKDVLDRLKEKEEIGQEASITASLGDLVEKLDLETEDSAKFNAIIERYCEKVDPKNKLSIKDAIDKLDKSQQYKLMDELNELSYQDESVVAKIKGGDYYTWYVYMNDKPIELTTRNGKHSCTIERSTMFGIRPSHTGKEIRLITQDQGLTIVYTIDQATKDELLGKSTKSASAVVHIGIKVTARKAKHTASTEYYRKVLDILKGWEDGTSTVPGKKGMIANGLLTALAEVYNGGFEQLLDHEHSLNVANVALSTAQRMDLEGWQAIKEFIALIKEAKQIGPPKYEPLLMDEDQEEPEATELDRLDDQVYGINLFAGNPLGDQVEKELYEFLGGGL